MKYIFITVIQAVFIGMFMISSVSFAETGIEPGTPSGGGTGIEPGTPGGSPASHQINFQNPLSLGENATISTFIESILRNIVVPIGAVVSVFFIIYAGFLFVTARGSEDKVTKAKTALLNAVIGTVIILGSWVIAQAISGTVSQLGGPTL